MIKKHKFTIQKHLCRSSCPNYTSAISFPSFFTIYFLLFYPRNCKKSNQWYLYQHLQIKLPSIFEKSFFCFCIYLELSFAPRSGNRVLMTQVVALYHTLYQFVTKNKAVGFVGFSKVVEGPGKQPYIHISETSR